MDKQSALIIVGIIGDLVLLAQVVALILAAVFASTRASIKNNTLKTLTSNISQNALILAFFVALFATFSSLFFSEIAHFVPCKLCWYQRIFMYPQVILLGIAAIKNDFGMKKYILSLSVVGSIIAIYHYILQMSPIPLPCSDEIANCALKQFAFFGYITIPLMSLTAFVLIILLMMFVKVKRS